MQKRIIPAFLIAALVVCGLLSISTIHRLQDYARVINYAGVIRGATQRLAKEELWGEANDTLLQDLDGLLTELQTGEGANGLARLEDEAFQTLLQQMRNAWDELKAEIQNVRAGDDGTQFYQLSEAYFDLADQAVHAAETYTTESVRHTEQGIMLLIVVFVIVAGLLMWLAAVHTKREEALQKEADEYHLKKAYLARMSEELRAPMNDISEVFYITDLENYDLLFLNDAGKRIFQVEGKDLTGRKCYEILQGQDAPCPFCSTPHLKPGENYTWEHTNSITGVHYLLKDRLIDWNGRPARMELAFDMTETEQRKQELQRALDVEKMLMECVRTLYQEPVFHDSVLLMLEQVGCFLTASHTYIILIRNELLYMEYEWCAQDVAPHLYQTMSLSAIERWLSVFNQAGCVLIEDTDQIKETNPEEYEMLHSRNIRSLVAAPLEMEGKLVGFLGVDNPPPEYLRHIAPLFRALCYFIMLAWQRSRSEQEMFRLSYYDTLTNFYNRNRYMHDLEALATAEGPVGIIYLDVNGLKDINDQMGHAYGDTILVQCADLMRSAFVEKADFYRIGGDEFVIICTESEQASFVAQAQELRRLFQNDEVCRAAIGVRWTEDTKQIQQIVADADAAMYEDKKDFYRNNPTSKRYRHSNDTLLTDV